MNTILQLRAHCTTLNRGHNSEIQNEYNYSIKRMRVNRVKADPLHIVSCKGFEKGSKLTQGITGAALLFSLPLLLIFYQ